MDIPEAASTTIRSEPVIVSTRARGFRLVVPGHRKQVTRYSWLIKIGEAQAWLARTWRNADSEWTKTWTLALWLPTRACFCVGYWLVAPPDQSAA